MASTASIASAASIAMASAAGSPVLAPPTTLEAAAAAVFRSAYSALISLSGSIAGRRTMKLCLSVVSTATCLWYQNVGVKHIRIAQ